MSDMPTRHFVACFCIVAAFSAIALPSNAHEPISDSATTESGTLATVNAASCAYAAVTSAVEIATAHAPGITVNIPPGDCDWGVQQLTIPGGIYLRGAGQALTIIRRIGNVPNTRYLIAYDCANGQRAVFSDISLVGNGDGTIQDKGLGLLCGCIDFEVTKSTFSHFIFSAIYVGDTITQRGVIHNNIFIDNYSSILRNLGYGVVIYGDGTWPELDLGSKNAVFVEDNYFSGNRHSIASNNGAIYVFRYNNVLGQDATKVSPP